MADKLIVKNFGPIRDAELDIKKTTVLIGPQGSGKSTLAKLVAIFGENTISSQIEFNNVTAFKNFNIHNYFFKNKTYLSFESVAHRVEFINNTLSFKSNIEIDFNDPDLEKLRNNFAHLPLNADTAEEFVIQNPLAKNLFKSYMSLYIPAERFLISAISESLLGLIRSDIALPKTLTNFGADYEIARKSLQNINISFFGVEFKHHNGKDIIKIGDDKEISLSESASGYQSLIPLNVYVDYFYNRRAFRKFFIVEEPELNLFPVTQKNLVQYLINKSSDDRDKILLTTHSPYVLSSLNLLVFAYQTAQKHPERIEEIKAIVPQESWINPDEFAAYYVDEGTVRSIISPKTGLIAENELDEVSDMIGDEFDALKRIYISKTYAGVN